MTGGLAPVWGLWCAGVLWSTEAVPGVRLRCNLWYPSWLPFINRALSSLYRSRGDSTKAKMDYGKNMVIV